MDTYDVNLEFDCYDGRNNPVHIDSLADIRKLEKESEQQARNGEGQQMVWRKYSNDRGNTFSHTLKKDPSEQPTETAKRKFGRSTLKTHGEHAPESSYGPGVSDQNTSALPLTGSEK
jgi:hypothetical protein